MHKSPGQSFIANLRAVGGPTSNRWFYAVMSENGITWSTAERAASAAAAKRALLKRYPHATVFSIEA
jgi:hypothetical protein